MLTSSSTGDYYFRHQHPPNSTNTTYFAAGQSYAPPQGSSCSSGQATAATLGLPGRASLDLSAYFDPASQYRRQSLDDVNDDEAEGTTRFKVE